MLTRDYKLSEIDRALEPTSDQSSSNIKMLLIAAAFLCVTIGLILIMPEDDAAAPQQVAMPQAIPAVEPESEVSRADASLLQLDQLPAAQAVSQQLRQPIRLTDSNANRSDLRKMTASVLADFGYAPRQGDRLLTLLVQALSEGQSNAYIDALLNTAAARGEFTPPRQLLMSTGRMDTETLLMALVRQAQSHG